MKKMICLLFVLLLVSKMYSQVEWFPADAVWTYDYTSWGIPGLIVAEVLPEDTIINNEEYKKIKSTLYKFDEDDPTQIEIINNSQVLFRQEGNKIYNIGGKVIDFDKEVGDILDYGDYVGWNSTISVIDTIGEITVNNEVLKFQDVISSFVLGGELYQYEFRIVEKIGTISPVNSLIRPYLDLATDIPFVNIRCYHDNTTEYLDTTMNMFGLYCEEVPSMTNVTILEKDELKIYPNPTSDIVNIKSIGGNIRLIKIFSIDGRIVDEFEISEQEEIQINIGNLNSDYLIILGLDAENNVKIVERIIKNGG